MKQARLYRCVLPHASTYATLAAYQIHESVNRHVGGGKVGGSEKRVKSVCIQGPHLNWM